MEDAEKRLEFAINSSKRKQPEASKAHSRARKTLKENATLGTRRSGIVSGITTELRQMLELRTPINQKFAAICAEWSASAARIGFLDKPLKYSARKF